MSEHKHKALIEEWIKDTSRVVEKKHNWQWVVIEGNPIWSELSEYRFKPTKTEAISTLTYDEIVECLRVSPYEWDINKAVRVANAACKAERERIAGLPAVTSLSDDTLADMARLTEPWFEHRRRTLNRAIAQFQRDLLEGKI